MFFYPFIMAATRHHHPQPRHTAVAPARPTAVQHDLRTIKIKIPHTLPDDQADTYVLLALDPGTQTFMFAYPPSSGPRGGNFHKRIVEYFAGFPSLREDPLLKKLQELVANHPHNFHYNPQYPILLDNLSRIEGNNLKFVRYRNLLAAAFNVRNDYWRARDLNTIEMQIQGTWIPVSMATIRGIKVETLGRLMGAIDPDKVQVLLRDETDPVFQLLLTESMRDSDRIIGQGIDPDARPGDVAQ